MSVEIWVVGGHFEVVESGFTCRWRSCCSCSFYMLLILIVIELVQSVGIERPGLSPVGLLISDWCFCGLSILNCGLSFLNCDRSFCGKCLLLLGELSKLGGLCQMGRLG